MPASHGLAVSCLVSVYGAFLCDVRSSIACLQRVSWCCFYQVRGETSTQVSWCELEQRQTSLWDEANWFQVIYRISATLKQCPLSGRPGEGRTWASQAVCRLRGPGGDVGAARLFGCVSLLPCSFWGDLAGEYGYLDEAQLPKDPTIHITPSLSTKVALPPRP